MRVGEHGRVIALNRPTTEDRSEYEGKDGLLMRRLNVPWTPDHGALWELRFDDGKTVVFSESELAVVKPDGRVVSSGIEDLREDWGDAPRVASVPYRRIFGASRAPAVLALLVFLLAGVLLLVAGVADRNWLLGGAGAVLVLFGIGAVGVLIT